MTKLFFLFFYNVFHYFFTYIKISKKLSAKYKQQIKQRLQDYKIMLRKYIGILLKKKNDNMVVNVTKISQKMKSKSLFNMEQTITDKMNYFITIIRKCFDLENFVFL